MSDSRWAAAALSLALSADFARLSAIALPEPSLEKILTWLSAGFAAAAAIAAWRGFAQRKLISAAAGVCVLAWAGLTLTAAS